MDKEIYQAYFKMNKMLFNQFQGFGGNMEYMYRSIHDDNHMGLYEFRFIHNSQCADSSLGRTGIDPLITWYDILVIDLEGGYPNSIHFLMSTDEIEEVFNVKLK